MKNGVRFKRGERRDRKQKIIFYISLLAIKNWGRKYYSIRSDTFTYIRLSKKLIMLNIFMMSGGK